MLDILAEEGSDWFYGFFTFLFDVVTSPVEKGEEEEREEAAEVVGTSQDDPGLTGVILDLQNQ